MKVKHGWWVSLVDDAVHVLPVADSIAHHGEDCACGVDLEPVVAPDGSCGWLVTHHSLDGREKNE